MCKVWYVWIGFVAVCISCKPQQRWSAISHDTVKEDSNPYIKMLWQQDTLYVLKEMQNEFRQFLTSDTVNYPQIKMLKTADDRTPTFAPTPNNLHSVAGGKPGTLQFKLCIDRSGKTTAILLLHADMPIDYTELDICVSQMFAITFEGRIDAPQYECIHKIYTFQ